MLRTGVSQIQDQIPGRTEANFYFDSWNMKGVNDWKIKQGGNENEINEGGESGKEGGLSWPPPHSSGLKSTSGCLKSTSSLVQFFSDYFANPQYLQIQTSHP